MLNVISIMYMIVVRIVIVISVMIYSIEKFFEVCWNDIVFVRFVVVSLICMVERMFVIKVKVMNI